MIARKLNIFILLINVVLLGLLGYAWYQGHHQPEQVQTEEPAPAAPAPEPVVITNVEREVITNQIQWAQLESEDDRTYIDRLRSIGCPEQTVRDIIIADLDKLLAPEIQAAYGRRKELKYWHSEEEEVLNDVNPSEAFRQERAIDKRKREIIRELTEADLARERMKASGLEDYYERRLGFLPEERRTRVRELLETMDDAEQKIRDKESAEDGTLSGADRAELRALRVQREAKLDGFLTAQEKAQYELWLSPV